LYFGDNFSLTTSVDPSSFMEGGLAATEKGNVYVVWVDGNSVYFRSSQDNGTKFGNPVLLSNAARIASSPQIAATEKGNVYVVWSDKNKMSGDSDIILKSSMNGGEDFGSSDRISRKNDILSLTPQVAATEKGNVYVIRDDKNNMTGDSEIIFRRSTNNGDDFSRNVDLNRDSDDITISFSPQIAATEKGNVYAVWSENDIQFKEILDNGTLFSETISINNRNTPGFSPQIAATERGDVYLIWVDQINATNSKHLLFKRISNSFL
jgi:hypothetical protein